MIRTVKTFESVRYIEYMPNGTPKGIILYLHGLGEVGQDINLVERNEIPLQLKNGLEKSYIIVAPQSENSWGKNLLLACARLVISYNIRDKFVTGLSLGGMGTFGILKHTYDAGMRNLFKGAAIVCGSTGANTPEEIQFAKGVVIKAWHGTNDATIKINPVRLFMKTFVAEGGDGELVEYQGYGHNIWGMAYSTTDPNSFWAWVDKLVDDQPEPPVELVADKVVKIGDDVFALFGNERVKLN